VRPFGGRHAVRVGTATPAVLRAHGATRLPTCAQAPSRAKETVAVSRSRHWAPSAELTWVVVGRLRRCPASSSGKEPSGPPDPNEVLDLPILLPRIVLQRRLQPYDREHLRPPIPPTGPVRATDHLRHISLARHRSLPTGIRGYGVRPLPGTGIGRRPAMKRPMTDVFKSFVGSIGLKSRSCVPA
jgi:hypothetical protein